MREVVYRMNECLEEHSSCGGMALPNLPTRVLDIGDISKSRNLRLHISSPDERSRYAALSYCWGQVPQTVTTTETLQEKYQSISFESLSRRRYHYQEAGYQVSVG